jgi:hypothetical protein
MNFVNMGIFIKLSTIEMMNIISILKFYLLDQIKMTNDEMIRDILGIIQEHYKDVE